MWYFLTFLIGLTLSGVCFSGNVFFQRFCVKKEMYCLQGMSMVIVSIIPTIIICVSFQTLPFHFVSLLNWKLWLLAIVTVIFTSLIIFFKYDQYNDESVFTLCIESAFMEIPQRVMMQTFVCGLLAMYQKPQLCGILITALIWCASIIIQAGVTRNNNWKYLILELFASFVFSIGIGYVYYAAQCLVIPMMAHAAERVLTRKLLPKMR